LAGQRLEPACCTFDPPSGLTRAGALHEAHKIRVEAGGGDIACTHIADALMVLTQRRTGTLSD
jgi:hypothetical protein